MSHHNQVPGLSRYERSDAFLDFRVQLKDQVVSCGQLDHTCQMFGSVTPLLPLFSLICLPCQNGGHSSQFQAKICFHILILLKSSVLKLMNILMSLTFFFLGP